MQTFAINGFGRIGRTTFRVWWKKHREKLSLVAINTSGSMDIEQWVHLLKYDSNYGVFTDEVEIEQIQKKDDVTDENPVLGIIKIGKDKHEVVITAQRDPAKLPWKKLEIHTVVESTGVFLTTEKASAHIQAGAKRVVLSAPAKDGTQTSVLGVNKATGEILSNASCTTNCIAPVAKIISDEFGIQKATLTTIHAYTDNQNIQDNSHKKDMRRARAACKNLIPTSTGAAKATGLVIPELKGILDGMAVRIPVSVGSLSDLVFVVNKQTSVEEVNDVLTNASESEQYKGILAVTNDPVVSSDIVGRDESSVVDLNLTQVIGGDLVKIIAWYDNEWGYCCRLLDQVNNLT